MKIEAVLLTGGKSSRMGTDKASLLIEGEPLGVRLARLLAEVTEKVTVLGNEPISGCEFLRDESAFAGPLVALSRFIPQAQTVFLASCDLPLFNPKVVAVLGERLGSHPSVMGVVPFIAHRLQPLVALYRAEAFGMISTLHAEGRESMNAWLDALWIEQMEEGELVDNGIDRKSLMGVDTPEALAEIMTPNS